MYRGPVRDRTARVLVFAVIITASQGCATIACDSLCDHAERCGQACGPYVSIRCLSDISVPGGFAGDDCVSDCVDHYFTLEKECRKAIRRFAHCVNGQQCVWHEYGELDPGERNENPPCRVERNNMYQSC
jgi:hypothetical protein